MITRIERIFSAELFSDLRSAYISRARLETGRIADAREWMQERGFETVEVSDDALLTDDGREVMRAFGKAWSLRPEVHAQRLAEAVAQAKQHGATTKPAEPNATQPTTCMALIDGQLCGGTLIAATVCPRCALGKSGVAATLTCDVCGHVTAIMREAK